MEWNLLTAQNLAIIDREIGEHNFSPAEYEILRRVIYYTADLEYKSLLKFIHNPLKMGTAALTVRSTIIVDSSMIQVGIINNLQKTFLNPVYCIKDIANSSPKKNHISWALQSLLKRYPEAIFIIGENQLVLTALLELLELLESEAIHPALIIATPPSFIGTETIANKLENSLFPNIRIDSDKGGADVAVSIFNGLIDLAWLAHEQKINFLND